MSGARVRGARARRAALAAGLAAACGAVSLGAQAPAPPAPGAPAAAGAPNAPAARWPLRPLEHVDLWLHGFALVVDDTARVPLFRRGYRDAERARRARANAYTRLDAERDRLRQRLAANPRLALDAQFLALAFPSWEALREAADVFARAGGDPRRAPDRRAAGAVQLLAGLFPAEQDRDWLRRFVEALDDERTRYYRQAWLAAQRERNAALAAADSVWERAARPRLQRFLNGSQQQGGTLVPSLVIGGEGRTQGGGPRDGVVVVAFPERPADAAELTYVAAHELVGALVGLAVTDNVSPAEQRAGVADRYVSAGQVRAGYLLLRQAAPDLAAGYARFYLREAGQPDPGAGATAEALGAALAAAFPLPAAVVDAIARQLDAVQGGI